MHLELLFLTLGFCGFKLLSASMYVDSCTKMSVLRRLLKNLVGFTIELRFNILGS